LAQRDRFSKSTERKFSWENVEIKKIKDEKNKLQRVRPMPIVSQESVHAKPQRLPPNLAEIATIWDTLPISSYYHEHSYCSMSIKHASLALMPLNSPAFGRLFGMSAAEIRNFIRMGKRVAYPTRLRN
jgi:hypothetical protein